MEGAFDNTMIQEQFRGRAATFDRSARWVRDEPLLSLHCAMARLSRQDRVLDVCCGTGAVSAYFASRCAGVTGLDISLDMLRKRNERLNASVNADAVRFPFRSNVFDVVICRQAFHFFDFQKTIVEMLRVLKPGGGRIVFSQIVPFGGADRDWVLKIHRHKQPLLNNFIEEDMLKSALPREGLADIRFMEYLIEEPVTEWLKDTFLPPQEQAAIRDLFLKAPPAYQKLHRTRVVDGEVFDTMRWVIAGAVKV